MKRKNISDGKTEWFLLTKKEVVDGCKKIRSAMQIVFGDYSEQEAAILKTISPQELIYYVEILSPWPASNRDIIVHLKIEQDSLTKKMVFHCQGVPITFLKIKESLECPCPDQPGVLSPLLLTDLRLNILCRWIRVDRYPDG